MGLFQSPHDDVKSLPFSGGARPKSALSAGSTPSKALQEADCNSKFRLFGQAGGGAYFFAQWQCHSTMPAVTEMFRECLVPY